MTESNTSSKLDIRQVYIKDMSFESPLSPQSIVGGSSNPKIDINLSVRYQRLDEEGHYEVVLTIEANAKAEGNTMFLVEVQQAGLFQIDGYEEEEFKAIVGSFCPNILFPYAREAIASTVQRGGFPEFSVIYEGQPTTGITFHLMEERFDAGNILLQRELEIAASVQSDLLPAQVSLADGWTVAALCRPARHVGGDFFTELPGLRPLSCCR